MKLQQIMNSFRLIIIHTLIYLLALNILQAPIAAQDGLTVYDIVIRNDRVLDGAGNPWIRADIAIKNGRFVRISRVEGRGKREIDVKGRYVSPGWIDVR